MVLKKSPVGGLIGGGNLGFNVRSGGQGPEISESAHIWIILFKIN